MGVVSPWQRIALVSSLLWVTSIPLFVMVETNRHASNQLAPCVAQAYRTYGGSGALEGQDQNALRAAEDNCLQAYRSASIAPQQMLRLLALKEDKKQGVDLWLFMTVPIVLLGTAAWILIDAMRRLKRVFRRQAAVQSLVRTAPG
jgi:hypothetical protein